VCAHSPARTAGTPVCRSCVSMLATDCSLPVCKQDVIRPVTYALQSVAPLCAHKPPCVEALPSLLSWFPAPGWHLASASSAHTPHLLPAAMAVPIPWHWQGLDGERAGAGMLAAAHPSRCQCLCLVPPAHEKRQCQASPTLPSTHAAVLTTAS